MKHSLKAVATITILAISCLAQASIFFSSNDLQEADLKLKCFEEAGSHSYVVHLTKGQKERKVRSTNQGTEFSARSFITVQLNRVPQDVGYLNPIFVSSPLDDSAERPNNNVRFSLTAAYVRTGASGNGIEISGPHSSSDIIGMSIPLNADMSKEIQNPGSDKTKLNLKCFDIGTNEFSVYPNPALK